jgi:DNA transformation protein
MLDEGLRPYVLDHLAVLGEVKCRRMFGAYGLYQGSTFFGIIADETLYFKTDATTRPAYLAQRMQPLCPTPRQTSHSYYEVPPDVIENPRELLAWAAQAVRAQQAAPQAHRRARSRRQPRPGA